jgi:L-seryl-tRNA(Ser) seleniumtransferase
MVDAAGYATVEYDVRKGERGRRGARAERLAAELTGAEDAIVVNNCAAAAYFVLSAFASGSEVVISRGELVEIGGDFRVPDVLAASGATLREVGTTNRTKLADYERAIRDETRMLLRVHPSNYRIVGFTASPSRTELARLAHERGLIYFEDAGSGALVDLSTFGLADEPVIGAVIREGADLVSFSGDKLLGGPQCGIIAGKQEFIGRLRAHPLQRVLRVDKMTYAALEATLDLYRRDEHLEEIPVLRRMAASYDKLRARAEAFINGLPAGFVGEIVDGGSVIGGGSAPDVHPQTALIALSRSGQTAEEIGFRLRMSDPPVIARIADGKVLIDLRTVEPGDDAAVLAALGAL